MIGRILAEWQCLTPGVLNNRGAVGTYDMVVGPAAANIIDNIKYSIQTKYKGRRTTQNSPIGGETMSNGLTLLYSQVN